MKRILILLILIPLTLQHVLAAQTKLEPPSNSRVPDNFEQELAWEFPEEPKIVGQNKNGDNVYSVLESETTVLLAVDDISAVEQPSVGADRIPVTPELNQLITRIVLEHLPHEYIKDKKWGKQAKRWAGVNFRRDGDDGKLETNRRYKMVNHGTWQKYSAKLIDPKNQFSIVLSDLAKTEKGLTAFDVSFSTALKIDARQAKWVKGIQLYSLSAEGTAKVRLRVGCELGIDLDFSRFPPDLLFTPTITDAEINVDQFDLQRVSKAGGEVAQQISRLARKELEAKIDEKEQKLVKKLNKEIDKDRDKLRLSITDAIRSRWYKQAQEYLPGEVKNAIKSGSPAENPR